MKKQFAISRPALFALATGVGALNALAQSADRPGPADPGAPAPAVKHESAFSDYQPYREPPLAPWREVLEELARQAAAGHAGMGHEGSGDPKRDKEAAAAHGASAGDGHAGHAKPKPAAPAASGGATKRHEHMAMAKPHEPAAAATPKNARTDLVSGTGIIREIDNVKGRVKMTHDPIDALGWPGLTLFFLLKDGVRADQLREGEKVGFTLEKSASGYVISEFHKPTGGKEKSRGHHAHGEHK